MSTRHCTPMRTLVAMLLALALLLMLVLPYVGATETIALSQGVTLVSQTLDGIVLDATAAATATATVNVLLQRCTVQGAGLTVSGATTSNAAGSTATILRIFDTTVKDATLTFCNYLPDRSDVRIVNVTATMEGTTPLFALQNFYLSWYNRVYYGYSMTIQRVRATWGNGNGGSVVQLGGSTTLHTFPGQMFSFSEAVVTGAAHVLGITSEDTADDLAALDSSLNAFDLIEFRDARGAFVYCNTTTVALGGRYNGMVRFSNITMTGGQPFFEVPDGSRHALPGNEYGSTMFSAISNDGPLFSLPPSEVIYAASANTRFSFRHINVQSVMSGANAYTAHVPYDYPSNSNYPYKFYMGNITVAGKLLNTIDELDRNHLLATQLVGAYGEVIEVCHDGSWTQPSLGTAAAVNCIGGASVNAEFVELAPGVNRAECNCKADYENAPYCTTAVDPLVYYDAYSPSPATCTVDNCDSACSGRRASAVRVRSDTC